MATRPTIVVDIRASNATWDTTAPVPLQGLNNKTPVPIASKIANGWNGDEKPGAQEFNFYNNRNDQWVFWVSEGSAEALLAPHIKESDAFGNTAFGSMVAGGTPLDAESITVTPNFGTGETGIFCTNGPNKVGAVFETNTNGTPATIFRHNGTSPAGTDVGVLRVESLTDGPTAIFVEVDSEEPAIDITNTSPIGPCVRATAGPGDDNAADDGGPAFFGLVGAPDGARVGGLAGHFRNSRSSGDTVLIENTNVGANGDALVITGENKTICIKATQLGGKSPAAKFEAGHNSGHSSAPIQLVPQLDDMLGDGLTDAEGSVWIKEGFFNGDTQHHPRFFSGASGQTQKWIPWTNGPTCAIDKFQPAPVSGDTNDTFFDIFDGLTIDFDTDAIPLDTGVVIIHITGDVHRTSIGADIDAKDGSAFRVTDTTAGGDPVIHTQNIDLPPKNLVTTPDENRLSNTFDVEFEYTLPAAGQRVFLVEMARASGSTSGSITAIHVKFHLRPRA